jgi:hypothetical protein
MSQSFVVARLSLNEEETEPFRVRSLIPRRDATSYLRLLRSCGRAIASTETLPAPAITPLDKTWSKSFAAAIATDELV